MKNVTILLAVLAMLAVPAFAQTHCWNGEGDGVDWHDENNWDVDEVPSGSGTSVYIGTAGTVAVPITISAAADPDQILLGAWGSAEAHLKVTATGSIHTYYEIFVGYDNDGTYLSTLTQTGGSVIVDWYGLHVGKGGAWGRYTMSGGTLSTGGSSLSLGTASGTGEFIVDCSGAAGSGPISITTKGYDQNAASTLEFKLDDDGGARAITVDGNVSLSGTLTLTGTRASTDALVLMTYTGSLTGSFSSEPDGWDISYDNNQVTATIPEPATMSLLVIGGLGALLRRRKK